jgi:chromosome partitioning protein
VRCSKCGNRFVVYRLSDGKPELDLKEVVPPNQHRIIAISNQKGGVAKTSTCLNLGGALALLKKRVLLIDFDVQANLTILLGLRNTKSFYEVLESGKEDISDFIEKTKYPGVYVLPSNSKMALLKRKYINQKHFENLLRDRLKLIKDNFDHILIDTPPSIEFFTLNALVAAYMAVIPTTCEYLSMHGINQIKDILTVVTDKTGREMDYRVLVTMYNPEKISERVIFTKLKDRYKDRLLNTTIELDDKMQESHIVNMPVIHYDSNSSSALQYIRLAEELVGE